MGRVTVAGGKVGMEAPSGGILASSLAIGSTVKLMENGSAVEYLVVHNGNPNTSLYDSSCNGLWLLRKALHSSRTWDATNADYANSDINTWLNGTFYNTLGSIERSAIKQVKVPYCSTVGNTMEKAVVSTGSSGFSTKVFLLTENEVGITSGYAKLLYVGAKLSYFGTGTGSSAANKRIGYYNGTATDWWLRVPCENAGWGVYAAGVSKVGTLVNTGLVYNYSKGVRPCVVLPSTAMFDAETMILKGVT